MNTMRRFEHGDEICKGADAARPRCETIGTTIGLHFDMTSSKRQSSRARIYE
jgi:hypothetical protein